MGHLLETQIYWKLPSELYQIIPKMEHIQKPESHGLHEFSFGETLCLIKSIFIFTSFVDVSLDNEMSFACNIHFEQCTFIIILLFL